MDVEFDAIVDSINQGEGFSNITVKDETLKDINIKVSLEQLENIVVGNCYHIKCEPKVYKEKDVFVLNDIISVFEYYNYLELAKVLNKFYPSAPVNVEETHKYVIDAINSIKNENISRITKEIYETYKNEFVIYPAATKFHHAYVGGLMYHTKTMLEVASKLLEIYSYMNKDLVFAGIILHDILKVKEFNSPIHPNYSVEGQLIGHLVLSALEIEKASIKLNIDSEEVLLLKHIVLSHHGQFEYGSPKKPMIKEAVLVSLIDNMDSKLTMLGEQLAETPANEFSQQVNVLERTRIFNHNIK